MTARVYCLASAKGGSGKTVIAASLAGFLSEIGKKCAVIDCDASTHGMTLLYLTEVAGNSKDGRRGVFEFANPETAMSALDACFVELDNGVVLLPATYEFSSAFDPRREFNAEILRKLVEVVRAEYDFVFLDAQAGSDGHARLCMSEQISDEVILISEYDPLSAAGVERLKQVVRSDLVYRRTWVLLNKMLPEFVERFSEFLSVAKYLPPIPWNADVVRAYARRRTALDLERGNEFTLAIKRTVEALMGDSVGIELETWSNERAYALKAPLEEQYAFAEQELAEAFAAKQRMTRQHRLRTLMLLYGVLGIVAVGVFTFQELWSEATSWNAMFGATIAGVAVVSAVWFASIFRDGGDSTESARYDRRIERLEGKLRQLEVLRAANYEGIVTGMKRKKDP